MSAHVIALPHGADTQTDAEADANAEAPPVSVNEDTLAHQVVNGDTVAHHGAERGQVGVEAYGDLQSQSHTAQQVCSILSLAVSVAQCHSIACVFKLAVVTESGVVPMHAYLFDSCRSVIQSYIAALNARLSHAM